MSCRQETTGSKGKCFDCCLRVERAQHVPSLTSDIAQVPRRGDVLLAGQRYERTMSTEGKVRDPHNRQVNVTHADATVPRFENGSRRTLCAGEFCPGRDPIIMRPMLSGCSVQEAARGREMPGHAHRTSTFATPTNLIGQNCDTQTHIHTDTSHRKP